MRDVPSGVTMKGIYAWVGRLLELNDRLRTLRSRMGLYQKELAEHIGVARSTVAAWEVGTKRPEGRTLELLADFFGVSVDYLLGRDEPGMEYDLMWVGFGHRIREARVRAGVTIRELSAKTGLDPSRLILVENDRMKPDEEEISLLCSALGVSHGDLFPPHSYDPEGRQGDNEVLDSLVYFLRGSKLTPDDVEAIKDLLEARRLRREREQSEKDQPG